ncbi:ATP-dependent DNA helicase [Leptospira perolatii]|uniref:DNA 3'-5' helicase n=1 Tax=Leptospira perolatii TaxID=2023191 RepID=A0A2M9ZJQ6_9LEPT|nr:ATP-dependent helicase [Leptospira perolatii]PJZ69461.1 ATP-dependent DNA helicase [Leptospira perolatii]PJZ72286.1 ATP-dependent DNA helicase [Leptospira perolatii]
MRELAKELNSKQIEAVTSIHGPVLVIAGAGTGKTNTLVHRLAHLVDSEIPAEQILLLTFTRKASREMLSRATRLLDQRCSQVHGGTFHSFCSHILRKYGPLLGIHSQFSILDESDSVDILQLIRTEGEYASLKSRFPSNEMLVSMQSTLINTSSSLEDLLKLEYPRFLSVGEQVRKILEEYKTYKKSRSLLDYDDLLVYVRDLLVQHEGVRKKLSEYYRYIMIDEFQDTNKLQAHIACLLASEHENIFVVGDDAQSIYSFRGASVKGIFDFPKIFPSTKLIYLEQNYRSTPSILNFANAVLENFSEKYEKYLYTKNSDLGKPTLLAFSDELEEAEGIADLILEKRENGISLKDIAVLFRSGWNSTQLELVLTRRNIPYQKFGGRKFVESAHAKDLISFLRIHENPFDSVSWLRVLLLLPGIGIAKAKNLLQLLEHAQGRLGKVLESSNFSSQKQLADLSILQNYNNLAATKLIEGYIEFYRPILEKKFDDAKQRLEDLNSFLSLSKRFDTLHEFLVELSLDGPAKNLDKLEASSETEEPLTLSTIHSAKGLEFDSVFLLNVTEGSFPSSKSQKNIEEERRLFYVGITRAKKDLNLTYPQTSTSRLGVQFNRLSRFIEEISNPENVFIRQFANPSSKSTQSVPNSLETNQTNFGSEESGTRKRIRDFFGS